MTEPRAKYRSSCGTVIFGEFRDPVSRAMYLDGSDSMASYRVQQKPDAGRAPVQLALEFCRQELATAPKSPPPPLNPIPLRLEVSPQLGLELLIVIAPVKIQMEGATRLHFLQHQGIDSAVGFLPTFETIPR